MLSEYKSVKDCPLCCGETFVIDTRTDLITGTILRKRECRDCGHRFKTQEVLKDDLKKLERRCISE